MSTLPHITFDTGKQPQHSIIWLHGLGADGQDFAPVATELKLPVPVRYLFPHAPMRPVTINGGFVMRAWYDVIDPNISGRQHEAGIRTSQLAVEALIAQEIARGIAPHNIFLAGFSQGGAVVLHTALRQTVALGGVLALSTYLPLAAQAQTEMQDAAKLTPIFMAHGRSDDVIPYRVGELSKDALTALGCTAEWRAYRMPHSVCDEELRDIEIWLTQHLHPVQPTI
jgi:phospholipase/carboxylesterase